MKLITSCVLLVLLFQCHTSDAFVYRLISDLLSNNVAGAPVLHERTDWNFDPEAARNSRAIYYETHGFRGEKFIERIGVGEDGKQDERRAEQQQRDFGRLNGEHWINYPGPKR
ncbi:uncharacterized protein LOC101896214 [Musca domestica]|uniref:Uncharacterized protein LOC101896214 n=1 Tax=Musca domestica TaxID=7370 RepID=A0A1I8MXP8_MUSDO|nr:uncharacterized protein LOC101896214 [Musca domestica]